MIENTIKAKFIVEEILHTIEPISYRGENEHGPVVDTGKDQEVIYLSCKSPCYVEPDSFHDNRVSYFPEAEIKLVITNVNLLGKIKVRDAFEVTLTPVSLTNKR